MRLPKDTKVSAIGQSRESLIIPPLERATTEEQRNSGEYWMLVAPDRYRVFLENDSLGYRCTLGCVLKECTLKKQFPDFLCVCEYMIDLKVTNHTEIGLVLRIEDPRYKKFLPRSRNTEIYPSGVITGFNIPQSGLHRRYVN